MSKISKEEQKEINDKLKEIKLSLKKIPTIFKIEDKIKYKPLQEYDNTNYKVYHYVDIQNIEIYITNTTRLEETNKKYKYAQPLINFLQPDNEELEENYEQFLNMVKELDLSKLEELEKVQEEFQKRIPFEVKYNKNFIWGIYYSELEDKYFMMFPSMETQVEALFYLIKKQIELQKSKKKEYIYVPVNNMEHRGGILRKSEIADLENYIWYFTGQWPNTYEVQEKEKQKLLQIVGKTCVYDKIESFYKMSFSSKEEAQEYFKLIKALFILKSNANEEYEFKTLVDEKGILSFYYNHNQITFENLGEFIKNEVQSKKQKIGELIKENLLDEEKLQMLKDTIAKQNAEYIAKEKQIVTFLECKKSFFGRISYFFKSKKKKKTILEQTEEKQEQEVIKQEDTFEEKKHYTLEDLLKICKKLQEQEKEHKDKKMDIKALENKSENLELKIKNATIYINEIESHKKSIFDFWKFTNKDEKPLLTEAEIQEKENKKEKLRKVFSYEEDIEQFGKKIDKRQRDIFSEKECDAIFAIYQDIETFNIDTKEKKLKKDDKLIEKIIKQKQREYEKEYEQIKEKEADIFGNVIEDKTKEKLLRNQKHREIEKDKYKILDIHPTTTLEEYKDNIHHYEKILEDAYLKMLSPYDIKIYKADKQEIKENNWIIMNMNASEEIEKCCTQKSETFVLNVINIKEKMLAIFYSNIMFYDNLNNTLPEGMDISKEVLLDLKQYDFKLVGRKDLNINFLKNEYENEIKKVEVYEYDIERRKT